MLQQILVYGIVAVCVALTAWLLWRSWRRPADCARRNGCSGCPLADDCTRKNA
ncbi:MAG: hypothetical protein IJV55_06835 [Paludibacteraceae bacterium]|nr:hypothetical protein [Paludibacteraceae bacterium]